MRARRTSWRSCWVISCSRSASVAVQGACPARRCSGPSGAAARAGRLAAGCGCCRRDGRLAAGAANAKKDHLPGLGNRDHRPPEDPCLSKFSPPSASSPSLWLFHARPVTAIRAAVRAARRPAAAPRAGTGGTASGQGGSGDRLRRHDRDGWHGRDGRRDQYGRQHRRGGARWRAAAATRRHQRGRSQRRHQGTGGTTGTRREQRRHGQRRHPGPRQVRPAGSTGRLERPAAERLARHGDRGELGRLQGGGVLQLRRRQLVADLRVQPAAGAGRPVHLLHLGQPHGGVELGLDPGGQGRSRDRQPHLEPPERPARRHVGHHDGHDVHHAAHELHAVHDGGAQRRVGLHAAGERPLHDQPRRRRRRSSSRTTTAIASPCPATSRRRARRPPRTSTPRSTRAHTAGGWRVVLVHGFTGGTDGAYQPVPLAEFINGRQAHDLAGRHVDWPGRRRRRLLAGAKGLLGGDQDDVGHARRRTPGRCPATSRRASTCA